ncbi:MAG TPA: hypothetical protein PKJ85_11620, partial [Nitrosomonas nitrosa]|nr:hypothetical protein [Nitrosomonas nitrosa]
MKQKTDGIQIARERIAHEADARTGFLDLGRLGLTALPEEIYKLHHLRSLNLGRMFLNEKHAWITSSHDISPNKIRSDLAQLTSVSKLKMLFLGGTDLINLAGLEKLRKLQILDCSETQISDLSPLSGLQSLQKLDCFG